MPRRLLLAAELITDVAHTSDDRKRQKLLAIATELRATAVEFGDRAGIDLRYGAYMESLRPVIRRLAAAFDPEVDTPSDMAR